MITHKVDLVFLIYDDLTGKIIKDNTLAFIINGIKLNPIKKDEGYYIFTNLECSAACVEIVSEKFHTYSEVIDLILFRQQDTVMKIRLIPSKKYYKYNDVNYIKGNLTSANERIYAVPNRTESDIRLSQFKNTENENILTIYNDGGRNITGCNMLIVDKDTLQQEKIVILKRLSVYEYEIDKSIDMKFKRNSCILRIFNGITDENGNFEIIIPNDYKEYDYTIKFINEKKYKPIKNVFKCEAM